MVVVAALFDNIDFVVRKRTVLARKQQREIAGMCPYEPLRIAVSNGKYRRARTGAKGVVRRQPCLGSSRATVRLQQAAQDFSLLTAGWNAARGSACLRS